jgi:uncharacterized membrane protein
MRFETSVLIEAPVEVVWRLTMDVTAWPTMTPTMTRIVRLDDGPLRIGSRARVKQPRQPEAVWTVTRLDEGRIFAWQTSRMGLTMTGSHILEPAGNGCRNTLTLDITGPGSGVFARLFGRLMRSAIETENAGFKRAAEHLSV